MRLIRGRDGLLRLGDGEGGGGVEAAERHRCDVISSPIRWIWRGSDVQGRAGEDEEAAGVKWHLIQFFIWSLLMTWHSVRCSLAAGIDEGDHPSDSTPHKRTGRQKQGNRKDTRTKKGHKYSIREGWGCNQNSEKM